MLEYVVGWELLWICWECNRVGVSLDMLGMLWGGCLAVYAGVCCGKDVYLDILGYIVECGFARVCWGLNRGGQRVVHR